MTMHEDEAPTQQCGSAGTKCIWRLMDQSQMSGRCNGRTVLKPGFGGDDYDHNDMDVEGERLRRSPWRITHTLHFGTL